MAWRNGIFMYKFCNSPRMSKSGYCIGRGMTNRSGKGERMWLLDYEFVVYSHPLLVKDVLWVTNFQPELSYLPRFQ